jgi:hypothetical protein
MAPHGPECRRCAGDEKLRPAIDHAERRGEGYAREVDPLASLRRLTDPHSAEFGVVSSLAVGALSLIDPNALTPARRLLYRTGLAGLTAAMTWLGTRGTAATLEGRVGTTVGATGAALGFAEASEALDGRLHHALVDVGVRRPRVVIAAAAAAFTAATFVAERAVSEHLAAQDELDGEDRPLTDEVRSLAAALLARTDDFGAPELRAQLASAQERTFRDDRFASASFAPASFASASFASASFVQFAVADDAPLAVPGTAVFPVTARSATDDGRLFVVSLSVVEGRLSSLEIVEVVDEAGGPGSEPDRWPEAHEVTLHLETPRGPVPLG